MTYQLLSIINKYIYFENQLKFKSTLHNFIEITESSIIFKINSYIVNVIINEIFFHLNHYGSINQQ